MYEITKCFETLFLPGGGHQLLEDRKLGIPTETRCSAEGRDQKLQKQQRVGDVEVVCDLHNSPIGKRRRT